MSHEIKMTVRTALFRHSNFGWVTTFENHGDDNRTVSDYARVSEWQDIEFKPLPIETIVEAELAGLTKLRTETVEKFTRELRGIDERMANCRALTGPVTP